MNRIPLVLALATALAFSGHTFAHDHGDAHKTDDQYVRKDSDSTAIRQGAPQSGTDGRNKQAPGVVSDGEALGILQAINEQEIAAAELAKEKGVSAPVMQYAETLEKEHRANHSRTRVVSNESDINTFESKDVEALRAQGKQSLQRLEGLSGSAFEAAFLDAMVQQHRDALAMIDDELLPASKDPAVEKHLRETRAHIEDHLATAQRLSTEAHASR